MDLGTATVTTVMLEVVKPVRRLKYQEKSVKNSARRMVINVPVKVEAIYARILTNVQMTYISVTHKLPAVAIVRDPTHVIANPVM